MKGFNSVRAVGNSSREIIWAVLFAAALSSAACGKPKNETGSASIVANIKAATPDQVQTVRVTVTAPDIAAPIVSDLSKVGLDSWRGTIGAIPVGPNRTFTAQALGSAGELLYQGSAQSEVLANQTAVVILLLQQATPPVPFANSVPYFTSLVASSNRTVPGGQVALRVAATDPDGDVLTYTWSANGGSYNGAVAGVGTTTGASVTWNAPATEGAYTLTVEVSDGKGGTASLSLTITVSGAAGQTGSADVQVSFNTWPSISSVTGTRSPLVAGQPVNLAVVASDADGDALSYGWVSTCAGVFTPSAVLASPTFTLDAASTATGCTFTVTVNDGRGGYTTGSLTIRAGASVVPTIGMVAVSQTQGLVTSEQGTSATFTVRLMGAPAAEVTVAVTSQDATEGTVAPSSLVFTPGNWSTAQAVTVTGAPDDGDTADQGYTVLVGPCTSADPLFAAVLPVAVSLVNRDLTSGAGGTGGSSGLGGSSGAGGSGGAGGPALFSIAPSISSGTAMSSPRYRLVGAIGSGLHSAGVSTSSRFQLQNGLARASQ